jgi:hypothetical protein
LTFPKPPYNAPQEQPKEREKMSHQKIYPERLWLLWQADKLYGITCEIASDDIRQLYDNVFHRKCQDKTYVQHVKEDERFHFDQTEQLLNLRFNGYEMTTEDQVMLSHNILALSAAFPEKYSNEYNGCMTIFNKLIK